MKKKYFILIVFALIGLSLSAQQEEPLDKQFYYYKGEKNYLFIDFTRISVVSKGKTDEDKIRKIGNFPAFKIKNNERSYIRHNAIPVDEISKSIMLMP